MAVIWYGCLGQGSVGLGKLEVMCSVEWRRTNQPGT